MSRRGATIRRFRIPLLALAAAIVVVGIVVIVIPKARARPSATPVRQQIALPAYINPTVDAATWARLVDSPRGTVAIAVANVLNGPGDQPDLQWAAVIRAAHERGIKVLGYVNTGYYGSTGESTTLGSTTVAGWTTQIETEIDSWYSFYGSDLSGIFFDRTPTACGPVPGSNEWATLYGALTSFVQAAHPGATTALNPGTAVPGCFSDSATSLVTFEGSYSDYVAPASSSAHAYRSLSWSPAVPSKVWNIIYGVPSYAALQRILTLSKLRRAGYFFATDATLPNPYSVLPEVRYWKAEESQADPGSGSSAPSS